MKHTTVKAAPAAKKAAGGHAHEVSIRKADNGGYTVRSHQKTNMSGPYQEPDEHVFSKYDEASAHMMGQFGETPVQPAAPAKAVKKAAK